MRRDNWSEEQLAAGQLGRFEMNVQARGFAASHSDEPRDLDFMCECGAADCDEWVPLTWVLYDELRDADEFVLAEGHVLQRAELMVAWARSLRGEAQALRAEARHQRARARRNRGGRG